MTARIKVRCTNWHTPSGYPRALGYVMCDGEMAAEQLFGTWAEAQAWADRMAGCLNWFGDNCPACTRCICCDNPWCRDITVSPGEGDGICEVCYETEDDE